MKDESANPGGAASAPSLPAAVDRAAFQAERDNGGPPDWPPVSAWPGGRPIAQWPRLQAGRSDDLAVGP